MVFLLTQLCFYLPGGQKFTIKEKTKVGENNDSAKAIQTKIKK